MNPGSKLGAFGLLLAAALGAGALAGNIAGPIDVGEDHADEPAHVVDADAGTARHEAAVTGLAAETTTVDGYEVALDVTPATGGATELRLTVRRDGEPVTDLAPHGGSVGRLTAVPEGEQAIPHVRPLDDGPAFGVAAAEPGEYRLYFDFSHDGKVRTAAFTVHLPAGHEEGHG